MAHICPPSAAVFTQTKWREIVRTKSYKMAADTYTEIAFSFSPASGMMNVQLAFLVNGRVLEIHNGTGSLSKNGKMMLREVKRHEGHELYRKTITTYLRTVVRLGTKYTSDHDADAFMAGYEAAHAEFSSTMAAAEKSLPYFL